MVVKENRGRKRYILFKHPINIPQKEIYSFLKNLFSELKSKIQWKIVRFEKNYGILLIDHKLIITIREILDQRGMEKGINTIKTSGTLKALMKN